MDTFEKGGFKKSNNTKSNNSGSSERPKWVPPSTTKKLEFATTKYHCEGL